MCLACLFLFCFCTYASTTMSVNQRGDKKNSTNAQTQLHAGKNERRKKRLLLNPKTNKQRQRQRPDKQRGEVTKHIHARIVEKLKNNNNNTRYHEKHPQREYGNQNRKTSIEENHKTKKRSTTWTYRIRTQLSPATTTLLTFSWSCGSGQRSADHSQTTDPSTGTAPHRCCWCCHPHR